MLNAGDPIYTSEGTSITFSGSASGGTTPHSYFWNFGDGVTTSGSLTPSHVYIDNATYLALLSVVDANGLHGSDTVTVTVSNVVPTITIDGPLYGNVGSEITFIATVVDPSTADWFADFTYSWTFGDGGTGSGQAPSHSYSSADTYTVSVTATDKNGATSAPASMSITVAAPTIISIDSTWLSANGPAPYILDQANATYQLQQNVTTNDTAFVILNHDITLDLNGYTVTYGNRQPITVPNGDFETGSGTNIPNWNVDDAPTATIVSNTNFLFGNQMLRLLNFSTPQTIISSAIPITVTGHTHTATITPSCTNQNLAVDSILTLSVIDSVTSQVLGTADSRSVLRGFSAVVTFTPTTTHSVLLQATVTPDTGVTDTVDLDAATLSLSYDYGVLASRRYEGELYGFSNFPTAVQTAYANNRVSVANFTLKNGTLNQGQGNGFGARSVFLDITPGITVDGLQTLITGMDGWTVTGVNSAGPMVVRNCTMTSQIPNISNRMDNNATIAFGGISGSLLIDNNDIIDSPQVGISIDTTDPDYSVIVTNNQINQNAVVTNCYGIALHAVRNFRILNNRNEPTMGRGFDLDGYTRYTLSQYGVIQDNYVEVVEKPNRESKAGIEARALRLRNNADPVPYIGAVRDVDISGNTFIARAVSGYSSIAYGTRVSYVNDSGIMDDCNINLHGNTIKAIIDSADTQDITYRGQALLIDGMDSGINFKAWDNILESNDISLGLAGSDGGDNYGITLTSNTLRKSSDGVSHAYTGIHAGYFYNQIHDVSIVDTILDNGATSDIAWISYATKDISIGWLISVYVQNADLSVEPYADVQVLDVSDNLVYEGITDSNGLLADIPVIVTLYQQLTTDPATITTTSFGPHIVKATSSNKIGFSDPISFTASQNLTITIA